jgi:pilus assembly protein CpaC
MHSPVVRRHGFVVAVMLSVFMVLFGTVGWGEPLKITLENGDSQRVTSTVGKSVVVSTSQPIKRVSLGAPEIADTLVLTPQQISIIGKTPGVTNLILWGTNDQVSTVLDIQVSPDVSRLGEMIGKICPEEKHLRIDATHDSLTLSGTVSNAPHLPQILALAEPFFPKKVVNLLKVRVSPDVEISSDASKLKEAQLKEIIEKMLPGEKDIKVMTAENTIILSGTVSSTSGLSQILALTEAYLPKEGKIANLIEVAGVHQVMLEVRVAEMSRSLQRRLGFNFNYISSSGRNVGLSLLNNLTRLPQEGFPGTGVEVSDPVNGIFRFLSHNTVWTVFIDALKEQGLLKVLAEPTLITLSGKSASFLAGGEFPIPVPQSGVNGVTITIDYKPFGVGLNFTPTVLSNKKISMQVSPEVSELDFSNAITTSGFVIPAITTRRVSTVIELADGQSFAIAGLLKDDVREIVAKFPVLGDIPILGSLFRSSSFRKNETELVVIVTPHLVKPLDPEKQTLPTDEFIEPDDFEFYLLGNTEGKRNSIFNSHRPGNQSRLEGSFGYIVPK